MSKHYRVTIDRNLEQNQALGWVATLLDDLTHFLIWRQKAGPHKVKYES